MNEKRKIKEANLKTKNVSTDGVALTRTCARNDFGKSSATSLTLSKDEKDTVDKKNQGANGRGCIYVSTNLIAKFNSNSLYVNNIPV